MSRILAAGVRVGQIWARPNGNEVKLTGERVFRGSREFELTPMTKGRKSWKWDGGIASELTFISDK